MNGFFTCGNIYSRLDRTYYGTHLAEMRGSSCQELTFELIIVAINMSLNNGTPVVFSTRPVFPGLLFVLGVENVESKELWSLHYDLKLMGVEHVVYSIYESPPKTLVADYSSYVLPISQADYYEQHNYSDDCHSMWANEVAKNLTIQKLTGY